ncbi:hypothetical protein L218DRAFT_807212, partial [Marasmius fiardii PR-910]
SQQTSIAFEQHCAQNSRPKSQARAKELLRGFSGAFISNLAETRGLDTIDGEARRR